MKPTIGQCLDEKLNHFSVKECLACFENACKLVVCQNGYFSLEIEQNQQNQKKKKIFMGD
ncbi:hypothetical protein [Helicobacter pylori]|uniref:hypothetical protein n=1 Tax=Helicobacter pylori TaxID=210 RepID=UPI001E371A79|nr:hypothetical protein [Helicobacter pylori]